ncbi:hypothetical protein BC834DRAFT_670547 [Gloeopeniophorella convolvens]|nr:hypothetical protein BC834DRAFT_670547 [Gloeopeniophorella convolvens]
MCAAVRVSWAHSASSQNLFARAPARGVIGESAERRAPHGARDGMVQERVEGDLWFDIAVAGNSHSFTSGLLRDSVLYLPKHSLHDNFPTLNQKPRYGGIGVDKAGVDVDVEGEAEITRSKVTRSGLSSNQKRIFTGNVRTSLSFFLISLLHHVRRYAISNE